MVYVVVCHLLHIVGTTTICDSRYAELRSIAWNNCNFDPWHSTVFSPPLNLNGKSRHCYSEFKHIRCSVAFDMQQRKAVKFLRKMIRFNPLYTESCLRRRIYISNAVATQYLGKNTCFQNGNYSDLLQHSRR